MKKRNILLVDPTTKGEDHQLYNESFLYLLSHEEGKIDTLLSACKSLNNTDKVQHNKTLKWPRNNRLGLLLTHIQALYQARLYKRTFLSSFHTMSLAFSSFLIRPKKHTVWAVAHNNISSLGKSKLNHFFLKMCFQRKIQIIVLEEAFKAELLKQYKQYKPQIHVIHHPLLLNNKIPTAHHQEGKKYIITYLGGNRKNKGILTLLKAIERYLKTHTKNNRLHFKLKIDGHTIPTSIANHESVSFFQNQLEESEYYKALSEADIVCLPFNKDFVFRCSATFFEALSLEKPMVLPNHGVFKNYKERYQDIGIFFESENIDSLAKTFEIINKNIQDLIPTIKSNLIKMKDHYNNKHLVNQYIKAITQDNQ